MDSTSSNSSSSPLKVILQSWHHGQVGETPKVSLSRPSKEVFTKFPELPVELQLLIWEFALANRDPRFINIKSADGIPRGGGQHIRRANAFWKGGPRLVNPLRRVRISAQRDRRVFQVKTSWKIPPILHVCHLSRVEAMKVYSLEFESKLGAPVYFDFERDVILLKGKQALDSFLFNGLRIGQGPYVVPCADWMDWLSQKLGGSKIELKEVRSLTILESRA